MKPVLVFDMDGVLVDVTESYRETICRTMEHFTGRPITRELVQEYKNRGGWNNDWALSQKICADLGVEIPYETVVGYFQELFLGMPPGAGLISRERWIARPGVLEDLAMRFRFGIFTGRYRDEARITLDRFATNLAFDFMVADDDGLPSKPAPDGLLHIRRQADGAPLWYVGDTVDDARAALGAEVPFIGIAAHGGELAALLRQNGAKAVLQNINELEQAIS